METLPGERLAVSDSYGGVFVTTRSGNLVHQIPTDGYSASSLSYSRSDDRLYVSLLDAKGLRSLKAFSASTFESRPLRFLLRP